MSNDFTSNCVPTGGWTTTGGMYGYRCTCRTERTETTVEVLEYDGESLIKRTVTKTTTETPYTCNNHSGWWSQQLGSTVSTTTSYPNG